MDSRYKTSGMTGREKVPAGKTTITLKGEFPRKVLNERTVTK